MPIWLRRFTYNKINKFYNSEEAPNTNPNQTSVISSDGKIQAPEHLKNSQKPTPTYVAKASTK
jgi:hypothetical protein